MKKKVAFLLVLVMAFSMFAFVGNTVHAEKSLRKNEIVRVGFPAAVASFLWSPLLVADVMGYFDAEGMDIVFEQSYSSSATRMVAVNQVEFSTPGPHLTCAAIGSGMEIISVFQLFPVDIFGFAVLADSGIETIADLKGKKIGTMTPTTRNQVVPIIEACGLTEDDVEMIPIQDARAQQLSEKTVDAVWTWGGEWEQWRAEGLDIEFLVGEDVYESSSNSVIANKQLIEEYPELIEGFTRALAKGCYFCYINPEAAADIILTNWPSLLVSQEDAEKIVGESIHFMVGGEEVMESEEIGMHREERWEMMMEDYVKMEIIKEAIPLEDCYTNDFVEAANDWDREEVKKDAENYEFSGSKK